MTHSHSTDVRMKGFRDRAAVADVLALLASHGAPLPKENACLGECPGRVLAGAIAALRDVPGYERAAMDGFAIQSTDLREASVEHPVELGVIGESLPARPFLGRVGPGQAVRIMTGAPIPAGGDAVLVAEAAEQYERSIVARVAVAAGSNFGRVGEDVKKGEEVFKAGRRLRPQDVGMLASLGFRQAPVVRRPRVAILATGNEILPPGSAPSPFHIIDSNSPMLAALVARDGGIALPVRHVPDRLESVRGAILQAEADVILVSGGSSVGTEDHAPRAVAELGELAVHGVAIRPAGPLGVGFLAGSRKPVFLLPGNPVSCLCAYDLFAGRVVRRLGGRSGELPYRSAPMPLSARVVSAVGRMDYVRVQVADGVAIPILGRGASALSSTVHADGFLLIEPPLESLEAGCSVQVHLYDSVEL